MKKKALAVPIVLVFATIMGIVSTCLVKTAQVNNAGIHANLVQLQAYFICRAGVEHAMLKVKYLHRELYDAACMSEGRNPLFNFSMITDINNINRAISTSNPGPIYLWTGSASPNGIRIKTNPGTYDRWLNEFTSDIKSTAYPDLRISNIGMIKNAQYGIRNISVGASDVKERNVGGRNVKENSIVVSFLINSSLETRKNEQYDYNITKTMKINRDL